MTMKQPENPFAMRASEQIENSSTFLRLFGDSFLDFLSSSYFVPKVHIFISAPGAGKTTLFRVFSPDSLMDIHINRANEPYNQIFTKLRDFGIISNQKPQLLGMYLRCTHSFTDLDDLDLSQQIKNKLFLTLLASRIIIIALRGILELNKSNIENLSKINFKSVPNEFFSSDVDLSNGQNLYYFISNIENKISKILNNLDDNYDLNFSTINSFNFLQLLKPENIFYDGKSVISNSLFMLDDIHVLKKNQIKELFLQLDYDRPKIPIWLSERKEALQFDELIKGVTGRDFKFIELEGQLKNNFRNLVRKIADLRASSSKLNVTFTDCVGGSLDGPDWDEKFQKIISDIRDRIETIASDTKKYDLWLSDQENNIQSSRISAINWRALEILVKRKEKGGQQLLFDLALPDDELKKIQEYKAAAELFISHENPEIPYYCEFNKISTIATNNIEQFLHICNALFDESLTNSILKKRINVSLPRQEKILQKLAYDYLNEIPRGIPNGENAFYLLDSFSHIASDRTFRETASYLPGITGFGIHHGKYLEIINKKNQQKYPIYKVLEYTLRSCLANNILTVKTDYKQGPKNSDSTIVFYLNRLLCICFDLPLGYGGFKRTNPTELCRWLKPMPTGFGE